MNNQTHKSNRASDRGHAVIALSPPAFAARLRGCGGGEATPLEPRGAAAPRASVAHRLPSILGTSRILAVLCVYFTCIGASPVFAQQTNCTPAPSGLVSWWPADGFALDVIGTNNGTLQNGAGYAAGEVGQASSLNGINAYVQVANSASLHSSNQLTVTGWFKTTTLAPEWQNIFWKGDLPDCSGASCQNREYALWLNTAGFLQLSSTSTDRVGVGETAAITPSGLVSPGQWYHFAAVINSTAGNLQIYLNGSPVVTTAYSTNGIRTTGGPLTFGTDGGASQFFSGQLDEIALFNRALTSSEIAAAYAAGSVGVCFTNSPAPVFVDNPARQALWRIQFL